MRRIVGYRLPATKSDGFTTKPLIAVPSRLLKLIGSTGPSLTRESHASFCRDSGRDRKSTRLNSSHLGISYAVFCLKKKTAPPRVFYEPTAPPSRAHNLQQL